MANIMYLRRRPWFHTGLSNSKPELTGIHEKRLNYARYQLVAAPTFCLCSSSEQLITLKHLTAFSSPIQLLDLRKDFVLDQRVLRRDLLRVKGRVKSLLSFDTRSVYQEGVV